MKTLRVLSLLLILGATQAKSTDHSIVECAKEAALELTGLFTAEQIKQFEASASANAVAEALEKASVRHNEEIQELTKQLAEANKGILTKAKEATQKGYVAAKNGASSICASAKAKTISGWNATKNGVNKGFTSAKSGILNGYKSSAAYVKNNKVKTAVALATVVAATAVAIYVYTHRDALFGEKENKKAA